MPGCLPATKDRRPPTGTRDHQKRRCDAVVTDDPSPTPYVVVCRGPNCRERGGRSLRARLAEVARGQDRVRLLGYACFGQCDHGPNVVFYPAGDWYGGLCQPDAAERVLAHARGDAPLAQPPLTLETCERSQHLRNIADLVALDQRARTAPKRRWWWPF
jgi:(2Fe-2S) ferredoxin